MKCIFCIIMLIATLATTLAFAAPLTIPSDGSDGIFNPTADTVVDLTKAVTANWDSAGNGNGVYDNTKWAVVFKYQSVNIPVGVTVTFKNHKSLAPVVWLVQGNVTISGTVGLSADYDGTTPLSAPPGPGGIPGGFGPQRNAFIGGNDIGISYFGYSGSYNSGLLPLTGGHGGGYTPYPWYAGEGGTPGGGGGGAILIASTNTIQINGVLVSHGSGNGGAGSIRLVSDTLNISNTGILDVRINSMYASSGRIRIEANTFQNSGSIKAGDGGNGPVPSIVYPLPVPPIWPATGTPTLKILSINGVASPTIPSANIDMNLRDTDVVLTQHGLSGYSSSVNCTITLQATNVPANWKVDVKVVEAKTGTTQNVPATMKAGGTMASSTWTATVDIPANNVGEVSARASAQ